MATKLSQEYRERAKEVDSAAKTLLEMNVPPDVLSNAFAFEKYQRRLTTITIGKISSIVYSSVADLLDYLDARSYGGLRDEQRRGIVNRNAAIRRAASRALASEDWSHFDSIIEELEAGSIGEGTDENGSGKEIG
jgi:hypothetical protein